MIYEKTKDTGYTNMQFHNSDLVDINHDIIPGGYSEPMVSDKSDILREIDERTSAGGYSSKLDGMKSETAYTHLTDNGLAHLDTDWLDRLTTKSDGEFNLHPEKLGLNYTKK